MIDFLARPIDPPPLLPDGPLTAIAGLRQLMGPGPEPWPTGGAVNAPVFVLYVLNSSKLLILWDWL